MNEKAKLIIQILSEGPLYRKELKKKTGFTKSTLRRLLHQLISENIIEGSVHICDGKEEVLFGLQGRGEVFIPKQVIIVPEAKRVKGGKVEVGRNVKLTPIIVDGKVKRKIVRIGGIVGERSETPQG